MKHIIRAVRRDPRLWAARTAAALVFAYLYYTFASTYELDRLDDTPGFRFGVLAATSGLWIAAELCAAFEAVWGRRRKPSLPIDPHLPPTEVVYLQGEGDPEVCSCHGTPIEDGTVVMHWPQPAKLICLDQVESR